jgi:hypothetical protein
MQRSRVSLDLRIGLQTGVGTENSSTITGFCLHHGLMNMDKLRHDPAQGTVVWSAVRHPTLQRLRGEGSCCPMVTSTCKLRAPIGPRLMHSPGPSPGSLFLRAWRSVCFLQHRGPALSTGTRIGRMRRCSLSTVAYYRPTTACPLHKSPQPICQACPTACSCHLGLVEPRHGQRLRKGEDERQRENLLRSTSDGYAVPNG